MVIELFFSKYYHRQDRLINEMHQAAKRVNAIFMHIY